MDHARAKARARAWHGESAGPRRLNLTGWRTEYPEEFPVITTRKDRVDNIRPEDYNGYTPDDDQAADDGDLCACCARESKLARALNRLLDAMENATRWTREALTQLDQDEDQFAAAIARSLRGEK